MKLLKTIFTFSFHRKSKALPSCTQQGQKKVLLAGPTLWPGWDVTKIYEASRRREVILKIQEIMSSARERIHQNKLETTAEANEGPYLGTRNEIGSSSKPAELSLNVEIHPKYIGCQILHAGFFRNILPSIRFDTFCADQSYWDASNGPQLLI